MIGSSWMSSPAWHVAGWTMLHFFWVGALLGALAAAGRRLLRGTHPDVRYAYSLAALIVLTVAPAIIASAISGGPTVSPASARPDPFTVALAVPAGQTPAHRGSLDAEPGSKPGRLPIWLGALARALPGFWLIGSPLTFAYLVAGLLGADRLRRGRSARRGDLTGLCDRLAEALGLAQSVAVAVSDRVATPLLLGIVRPLILLPASALTGWTADQLEMVLLHELAHVRRCDNLVNLMQRLVESALFFHPAVWMVSGWVRREREHCCDQIVIAHTGRALEYAEALFSLSQAASMPIAHGAFMARNHLVVRIRRVLSAEDHTMKLSRTTIVLSTALLVVPVMIAGSYARQAGRSAPQGGRPSDQGAHPNRQPQSGMRKAAIRPRDPNARPWQPGPIPATVPIHISGVARDEDGNLVAGATVTLYTITDKGSKPVGTATTDREGHYEIRDAVLPVTTSFGGHLLPREITPYASFILCGLASGYGIAWSPQRSMYALAEPNPDDIQGRLPLNKTASLDLTFPNAAVLRGKVVDETGRPIERVKLQVFDCVLLDDAGRETNNRQGYDWEALPGNLGRAVTAGDGSFQLERLADRACYALAATRPESGSTVLSFFAATIPGPDTVHEQLAPQFFNGRLRHEVRTNPITITFPNTRPVAVTVVGDDNGKPLAGAQVFSFNGIGAYGFSSGGTTDASGKVILRLPPGRYEAITSDPPLETHYIRYRKGPLIVEPGEGVQPLEIRQQVGCELILEAVAFGTGEPIPDVFFWQAAEDKPDETQDIQTSTVWSSEPFTNAKGEVRAVLPPQPGKRYRFRFAGVHEPNMPPGINPEAAHKHGYEAFPAQSAPVELAGGKTIRLRFMLRKTEP